MLTREGTLYAFKGHFGNEHAGIHIEYLGDNLVTTWHIVYIAFRGQFSNNLADCIAFRGQFGNNLAHCIKIVSF